LYYEATSLPLEANVNNPKGTFEMLSSEEGEGQRSTEATADVIYDTSSMLFDSENSLSLMMILV
jgi:hypothetical protein